MFRILIVTFSVVTFCGFFSSVHADELKAASARLGEKAKTCYADKASEQEKANMDLIMLQQSEAFTLPIERGVASRPDLKEDAIKCLNSLADVFCDYFKDDNFMQPQDCITLREKSSIPKK